MKKFTKIYFLLFYIQEGRVPFLIFSKTPSKKGGNLKPKKVFPRRVFLKRKNFLDRVKRFESLLKAKRLLTQGR